MLKMLYVKYARFTPKRVNSKYNQVKTAIFNENRAKSSGYENGYGIQNIMYTENTWKKD